MADQDPAPAAPDDNYGVAPPTYITTNGDGTHQVVINGQLQTVATSQLPNAVLPDAIAAVNTNGATGSWQPAPQTSVGNPFSNISGAVSDVGNAVNSLGQSFGNDIAGKTAEATPPAPAPAAAGTQPAATGQQPQPAQAEPQQAVPQQAPSQAAPATGGGGGASGNIALANEGAEYGKKAAQLQEQLSAEGAQEALAEKTPAYAAQQQRDDAFLARQQAIQDQQAQLMQKRSQNADKWANEKLELPQHSLGQQLLSGLGIMLGGIGGGIQGTGNPVLAQMQQKTQQFIDMQKYNIDHGLKADDLYHNIYQDQRQLGADDEHAKALADNIYKTRLLNTLELHALSHGNTAAAQQFYQTAGKLKSDLANQHVDINQKTATTNYTNQNAAGQGLQNIKTNLEIGDLGFARSAQQKLGAGTPFAKLTPDERRVTYQQAASEGRLLNDGIAVIKPQPDDLKQRYAADSAEDAIRQLDAAVAEAKANPLKAVNPWAAVHGRAENAVAQLRANIPAMWGAAGASGLGQRDAEVLGKAIGEDPTKFLTEYEGKRQGLLAGIHSSKKQFNKHFQVQQFAPTPES